MTPQVRVGTSGWNYDDWTPEVYPPGLPKAKRRDVYASQFDTVELNASFYHWPKETSFPMWRDALPPGFRMTVKAPKNLTHVTRLRGLPQWQETLARDWASLGDKAGLFLVQLHPQHPFEPDVLDRFLAGLPPSMRVGMELRHESWQNETTQQILRDHGAAYVVLSGPKLPCHLWATADFVYVRFHGPHPTKMYVGEYSAADMAWWGERGREWLAQGREVWAYFNNDYDANGVRNARQLRTELGGTVPDRS